MEVRDIQSRMPRYQYVQIGFEPDTLEALDAIADEENKSRSEVVRECVQEGFE